MNSPRPSSRQVDREHHHQQQPSNDLPHINHPGGGGGGSASPRPQYAIPRSPLASASRPKPVASPIPQFRRHTPAQQQQQQQLYNTNSNSNDNNPSSSPSGLNPNPGPSRNSTPQPYTQFHQQKSKINNQGPQSHWSSPPSPSASMTANDQGNINNNITSPSPPGGGASLKRSLLDMQAPAFDYDDFRERYDAAMAQHMARDRELIDQYKKVAITLQAWVSVLGQYDEQKSIERRDAQILELEQKEAELEALRVHSLGIFNGFNHLLEQMNSNPPPPPQGVRQQQQFQMRSPQAQPRANLLGGIGKGKPAPGGLGGGISGGAQGGGGVHTRKRG
ncbi:hypothetical protein DFH27DRAFT_337921 [Peziza echinospora]|nr:hypothetical protein DFH27DRAFT_337921 [Peziza echinospora]